jgi:acetolactate synthase regulatory subunit
MTIPLTDILDVVFQRSAHVNMSQYANDVKTFNILLALDGKRSVKTVAEQDAYDPDELAVQVKTLYDQRMVEPVAASTVSKGRAKKILDAIIQKRSRGVGAIAKAIKIKLTLKGINPDSLTPDTPDDPVLLKKLLALARSYGLQVARTSDHSQGKTRLILDSIITQRSGGDPMIAKLIRTKLMLKGINPDAYSLDTPDDPNLVNRLMELAGKLGVKIPTAASRLGKQIEQIL